MCAVLNFRLEAESYFTFRLSFKIVAQYFGSASQLSCVPNSSSESQGFIGCYFLSSPLVASQSYEARPTLSASADKHSLTHTCSMPNKKPLSSKFRRLVSLLMAFSILFPSCPIAPRIPGIGTHENCQIYIMQVFHVNI